MNIYLAYFLKYILSFIIIYFIYKIFIVRLPKKDKKNKKDKKSTEKKKEELKTPVELSLFLKINNIKEEEKLNISLLKKVIMLTSNDIALALLITDITKNITLKFLIAIILVFLLIPLSYKLYGLIIKKGSNKNEL